MHVQRILLERPRLVSDHFYLATSIIYPNQNEARHLPLEIDTLLSRKSYVVGTHLNRLETIQMSANNIGFCKK